MPKFGEVFGTTAKVIAALFVISIIGGLIYAVIIAVGTSTTTANSQAVQQIVAAASADDLEADKRSTKLPESKWKSLVELGIKEHCAFQGMTKEEAIQALGNPIKQDALVTGSSSTFAKEYKSRCKEYKGETCIEYEQNTYAVELSPSGHVKSMDAGPGCYKEPLFSKLLNLR